MAMFVHLTTDKNIRAIRNRGIKPGRHCFRRNLPRSVFALPVTPSFSVSHQWLRELRRSGQRTICGVYFRVPDEETVWVGHYGGDHRPMTAAQAVALFLRPEATEGYEVLIGRKVERTEVHAMRALPQVVGWRYSPGAHRRPYCGCIACVPPGTIRARQKSAAWEAKQARLYGGDPAV